MSKSIDQSDATTDPELARAHREIASLATLDYPSRDEECDVIMKGGITSGVVYPLTICRLATKYRLRSIGGTSAGAIAAGVAAAAEYRRRHGPEPADGFRGWRSCRPTIDASRLLFQPPPATQRLFDVLFTAVDPALTKWRKRRAVTARVVAGKLRWFLAGFALTGWPSCPGWSSRPACRSRPRLVADPRRAGAADALAVVVGLVCAAAGDRAPRRCECCPASATGSPTAAPTLRRPG